ncbi:hypothetical protein CHS0354_001565 [Potamilus streckersoni]|uniref:Dyp-type peroxidase C-terminal domain-containing protein n=1 Tax=Potamilus streckersoni TaxID=2493646 RepID=A0AAE0WA20_9BIVA|nr:hypothetical protein CHS0354_001565 [Potamilus streckersoni]
MAARNGFKVFQNLRSRIIGQSRGLGTKPVSGSYRSVCPAILGSVAVGVVGFGAYKYFNWETLKELNLIKVQSVSAAGTPQAQPSVWSQGKDHALYLWIELSHDANAKEVAKVAARLQKLVDMVTDPSMRDESDEIWAGVGFGPNFYKQIGGKVKESYTYSHRKGVHGEMPSSAGDVFIHAKCNTVSKLFELAHLFIKSLPPGSVKNAEDIYSFVYKNGRDLSGFIDGTENPADDDSRQKVAVNKETGGSYVITQKWIHDLKVINSQQDKTLESWVGRLKSDSTEISKKSITSHVARMTGGSNVQKKPFEIVRQSMPFGTVTGESGLFFIGYAASPENFNYMLDRMVGAGDDPHSDDIMRLSRNVKGTFWYFPGVAELKRFE